MENNDTLDGIAASLSNIQKDSRKSRVHSEAALAISIEIFAKVYNLDVFEVRNKIYQKLDEAELEASIEPLQNYFDSFQGDSDSN